MLDQLAGLFPDVDPLAVAQASPRFYLVEYGRGAVLIEEGEVDAAALFVLSGHIVISAGLFEIATTGRGAILGEIGLFGGALRTATVRAVAPTTALVLDRTDYLALLDQGSPVAWAVERVALKQLAGRLRDIDARLAALVESGSPPATGVEAPGAADDRRTREILDLLAASRLFDGAPIGVLDDLATRMQPVVFEDGAMLCREGARGESVYIVAEGVVDVVITGSTGSAESVALLEAGDVFGLASILEDRPRMASCFARGRLRALRLPAPLFRELVHADGTAGSVFRTALLRALGDQIAYANAQFGQLQLQKRKRSSELLARFGLEVHGRRAHADAT